MWMRGSSIWTPGKSWDPGSRGKSSSAVPRCSRDIGGVPKETERAFITLDGKPFFRTGDIGYYDEEGYFFIVDRAKRMINVSGYKVWPTEVESVLYQHPKVQTACVVGVPDPRRGRR